MTMQERIEGRAFVFGDNIDTDIIAPGNTISFGLGGQWIMVWIAVAILLVIVVGVVSAALTLTV